MIVFSRTYRGCGCWSIRYVIASAAWRSECGGTKNRDGHVATLLTMTRLFPHPSFEADAMSSRAQRGDLGAGATENRDGRVAALLAMTGLIFQALHVIQSLPLALSSRAQRGDLGAGHQKPRCPRRCAPRHDRVLSSRQQKTQPGGWVSCSISA